MLGLRKVSLPVSRHKERTSQVNYEVIPVEIPILASRRWNEVPSVFLLYPMHGRCTGYDSPKMIIKSLYKSNFRASYKPTWP